MVHCLSLIVCSQIEVLIISIHSFFHKASGRGRDNVILMLMIIVLFTQRIMLLNFMCYAFVLFVYIFV